LIKTDKTVLLQRRWKLNHRVTDTFLTERFATALETEPQVYRHILNIIAR